MKSKKRNYFERWYFRLQSDKLTMVLIPEILYGENGESLGRLQVLFPNGAYSYTYEYPVNMNLPGSLFVVLGRNVFTEACLHLDLDQPDLRIKGDIYFDDEVGTKFRVMGPLGVFPLAKVVATRQKVWAMEQKVSGRLEVGRGRESFLFAPSRGYLEEQRGRTLPRGYFWSHCNWFDDADLAVSCAGADVDFAGKKEALRLCFGCIRWEGQELTMATYKGARLERISPQAFAIRQGKYLLEGWKMEGAEDVRVECTVRYRLSKSNEILFDEISKRGAYVYR